DENVTNEFSIEMADKDKSPTAPLPSRVESSQYIPTPLVAASYEARLSGASFGEPRSPVNSPAFPEPTTEEPPVQEKSLLLTSDSDSESDTDLESSPIVDYRESRTCDPPALPHS
ncbi:hypothetical protein Bbelb_441320, partial [Branchiostoma belcheri]